MNVVARLDADVVREVARGLWRSTIYPTLGIDVGNGRHMPCPHCGGKDRFRCDDLDGSGSWYCNQCDPHAGDGFALIMKVLGCDFPEALYRVADTVGFTSSFPQSNPRPQAKLTHEDRRRIAFRLELHGVGLQTRAEATLKANSEIDCSSWTDNDFERAMSTVGRAFDDLAHAETLFAVADSQHVKAFQEGR